MTVAAANRLRRNVAGLVALAERDLRVLWRDVETPAQARAVLDEALAPLTETYSDAAATVAADWYDELRDAENIDGRFRAIVAQLGDLGTGALTGWALTEATEPATALTLVNGGLQRRIANAARNTVTTSTYNDPGAEAWQRVTGADACPFCQMLASRGVKYRTETTADFGAHDNCDCGVVPAWGGRPTPVRPYTPSLRYSDDAAGRAKKATDQARAKRWIDDHL